MLILILAYRLTPESSPSPSYKRPKRANSYRLCKLYSSARNQPAWGRGAITAANFSPGRRLAASLCEGRRGSAPESCANTFKTLGRGRLCKRLSLHFLRALPARQKFTSYANAVHKEPQIPLSGTSGKRLQRCLTHPYADKRELVPRKTRQHALLPPSPRGSRAAAFSRLHSTRSEENSPEPPTRGPLSRGRAKGPRRATTVSQPQMARKGTVAGGEQPSRRERPQPAPPARARPLLARRQPQARR